MAVSETILTALAIVVYATAIGAFHQVLSRRRLFARTTEVVAEEEAAAAVKKAKAAEQEVQEIVEDVKEGQASAAEVVEAAKEVREATEEAQDKVERTTKAETSAYYYALLPLLAFAYFMVLSTALLVLTTRPPQQVFSLALAILLATRISAYLSESVAQDIAKMLPLALLGTYLVQSGVQTDNLQGLRDLRVHWREIAASLGIVVVVEVALRTVWLASAPLRGRKWLRAKRTRR